MANKEWNKVIQDALWLYVNRDNITYNLGCAGEVVGRDQKVKDYFVYYYNHGWKDKMGKNLPGWNSSMTAEQAWLVWSNVHKGKMCFDCSGYLDFCIGYPGDHKYSSGNFANMKANKSIPEGPAGSALWKSGHVGLDIGYGYMLEIGDYNDTIKLNKTSTRNFTKSVLITGIDYTGADNR